MIPKTFLITFLAGQSLVFSAMRFQSPPTVELFPDGAVEWRGFLECEESSIWVPTRLEFSLDFDLDGSADQLDSVFLTPLDCSGGRIEILRTLFPEKPGLLMVSLISEAGRESYNSLCAFPENFLAIRTFCARPVKGEPEWIEIRNASSQTISLNKIQVKGKGLHGTLSRGESVFLAGDSAALLLWHPEVTRFAASTWPYLRNTGDTLRLAYENGGNIIMLDSLVYGESFGYAGEACASFSADPEEGASSLAGFAFELVSKTWKPQSSPFSITVTGPPGSHVVLRLYDLDGREKCVAPGGTVPATMQFIAANCRSMPEPGTAIVCLSGGKVKLRKAIQIVNP